MSRLYLITVLMLSAGISLATSDCTATKTYLEELLQQPSSGLTHSTPTSAGGNKCRLDKTCCTSTAESLLTNMVDERYQSLLFEKLNSTISPCLGPPLQSTASEFIDASRSGTLQSLQLSLSSSSFQFDVDIVNQFYDYLKSGILNMDLSQMQTKFQEMFFKTFLVSFREGLKKPPYETQLVSNQAFETCIYSVYQTFNGHISTNYGRLETRLNLYLRYLWAVKAGDEALSTILTHSLSTDCKESLLRMDYCSQCSGTTRSSDGAPLACQSLCLNSLQGCLVDLAEFGEMYSSYVNVLKAAKGSLNTFDPFSAVNLINGQLNTIIFTTLNLLGTIKQMADASCNTQYTNLKRKRSLDDHHITQTASTLRVRRQSSEAPLDAIDDSVTCSSGIVNLFDTLSQQLCMESSDAVSPNDYTCWNGTDVDSYRWEVPGRVRLDQLSNPELNVRADTGLMYKSAIGKLKLSSDELNGCQDNPRNCDVKLNGFTSPNGDNYDFGDAVQFQEFTELGFPEPVVVSVVPVAPASSSSLRSSTSPATSKPSPTTTTTTAPSQTTPSLPTVSSVSLSESVSQTRPPIVRPPVTTTTTTTTTTTSVVDFAPPRHTGIPDPDKPKTSESRDDGHLLSASLTLLTSLVLLIISLLL